MSDKLNKGKMIRVKSSAAEFIESQSKILNKSFLETLYYILNVYERDYVQSQKTTHKELNTEPEPENEVKTDSFEAFDSSEFDV